MLLTLFNILLLIIYYYQCMRQLFLWLFRFSVIFLLFSGFTYTVKRFLSIPKRQRCLSSAITYPLFRLHTKAVTRFFMIMAVFLFSSYRAVFSANEYHPFKEVSIPLQLSSLNSVYDWLFCLHVFTWWWCLRFFVIWTLYLAFLNSQSISRDKTFLRCSLLRSRTALPSHYQFCRCVFRSHQNEFRQWIICLSLILLI